MSAFSVIGEGAISVLEPSSSPLKSPSAHPEGHCGARQVPTLLTPLKCQRPIPCRQATPGFTMSTISSSRVYAPIPIAGKCAGMAASPIVSKTSDWLRHSLSNADLPQPIIGEAGTSLPIRMACESPRATILKRNLSRSDESTASNNSSRSKVKRFECGQCTMKFTRKDHLRRHRLIHTGDRPFQCEQCKQKFARKDHLKRHYRRHAPHRVERAGLCVPAIRVIDHVAHLANRLASFSS